MKNLELELTSEEINLLAKNNWATMWFVVKQFYDHS